MSDWVEIRAIFEAPPADWSLFADAFERAGCPSSLQETSSISGYLEAVNGAMGRADELKAELLKRGAFAVEIGTVPDQDWSHLWRLHFKSMKVGSRIWLRPTWEPPVSLSADEIEIVLDPGQAFGTGDHPTTRLCLRLMQQVSLDGATVYDLGCGSGVLAIAAAKLGAARVIASDIDETSVEVTNDNLKLNGERADVMAGAGFLVEGDFDVVLSNIISATLIRLAPEAATRAKAWIVSGIIEANWPDVLSAAERAGFKLEAMEQEDEWVGATFTR